MCQTISGDVFETFQLLRNGRYMISCSLNAGVTASSAQRRILVYLLIIGIQEYIMLFTESLLATVFAYRQSDLERK